MLQSSGNEERGVQPGSSIRLLLVSLGFVDIQRLP